jgi:hypothetical protein
MARATPATIILKGSDYAYEQYEHPAGGTIRPGHLVMLNAAGAVVVHGTLGAVAEKTFAVEDDAQGRGIDDNYSSGQPVRYGCCSPGVKVYALIATAQTIVIGDKLESNGDGTLKKQAAAGITLAVALEAVTTTASVARCEVRIA